MVELYDVYIVNVEIILFSSFVLIWCKSRILYSWALFTVTPGTALFQACMSLPVLGWCIHSLF